MKTDSMVELGWSSRLLVRDMPAAGETGWERTSADDKETTWADLRVVLVNWGLTADDIEEIRLKLMAARKAVIGGGEYPVYTVFWPEKGIPTGGEPMAVEKLEAEKVARAKALDAAHILVEWADRNCRVSLTGVNSRLGDAVGLAREVVAAWKKGGALADEAMLVVINERTGEKSVTTWGEWKADLDGGACGLDGYNQRAVKLLVEAFFAGRNGTVLDELEEIR